MPDRGKTFTDRSVGNPAGKLNTMYARTKPTITDKVSNYVSYYATASYMYDNRYSINLSVRGMVRIPLVRRQVSAGMVSRITLECNG